eukprot:3515905-Alexandrium_andersonii.AAC.1
MADTKLKFRIPGGLGMTEPVSMSRGVRQGGPMSPLLWLLAMDEVLGPLSDKWRAEGKGFDLGGEHGRLSLL